MNSLRKRILVVDDDPKFTRQIRLNLELPGEYVVREENRDSHALAAAKEFLPDLILLDVMMPNIDGGELASEIRTVPRLRAVPIVFLTAAVTPKEVKAHGPVFGGERFLAKPVGPAELMECLREELEKHSVRPVEKPAAEDTSSHIAY
jgi:CheY-like chemotaxis protein